MRVISRSSDSRSATDTDIDDSTYTKLTINTSYDVYDATVVAAFGGVRIGTGSNGTDPEPLHAFLMFIPSFLLYILQGSLMAAMSLELDLKTDVRPRAMEDLHANDRILIWIKISVYFIVQLQLFAQILGTLNLLVFILTPSTWDLEKVRRPDPDTMYSNSFWFLYKKALIMPWPIISLFFKLTIAYSVCVTSLSVILMAENAVECVFNSLAIAWISELGGLVWHILSTVAMLDRTTFQNFRFEKRGDDVNERKKHPCSTLCGAKLLTNLALLLMYWRQSLIVHMAIDSNILPAARDVCTAWRLIEGPDAIPLLNILLNLIPAWNQVIRDSLAHHADPEQGGLCNEDYYPTSFDDMVKLSANHSDVGLLMAVLTLFLFSPYLLALVSNRFGGAQDLEKAGVFANEDEVDIRILQKAITDQMLEHAEQREQLEQSHREIAELKESMKSLDLSLKLSRSSSTLESPRMAPDSLTSSRAPLLQTSAPYVATVIESPRAYGDISTAAPRVLQRTSYAPTGAHIFGGYDRVPHAVDSRGFSRTLQMPFG